MNNKTNISSGYDANKIVDYTIEDTVWDALPSFACKAGSTIRVINADGTSQLLVKNSDTQHGKAYFVPEGKTEVYEYANLGSFPVTGASGIIYIAIDTNIPYRWNGSTYASLGSSGASINTNYSVLTYASSIDIDVSQTVNNKYIEASGNFAIVMTAKPALADGLWGDVHIKKTTASDITITLDNTVSNKNSSQGVALPSITIRGGLNIEEKLRFKYLKEEDSYYWDFLPSKNNHTRPITIVGGGYTLSMSDFDFGSKQDQILYVTASAGNQDLFMPADIAIPEGRTITIYQKTATTVNLKKGNISTVLFNAAGYPNVVGQQSTISLASINSGATITCEGGNTYFINGDILG